ncbi:hypothetical protein QUB80_29075 [Chlorogloeopsis sp. ULAP01]|uniref:hypothetical protein n=1 Tax=Chlorogloeopsis sp. ULAP01 TaxID=3056483 RepID=UPI0025AAE9F9|nr:hypothetical protein [Chlorogloeopsis sp. ULAP01]MDM9384715.1 hypothetical protein [Chlorogloeopsis sp. ULAP01]
MSQNLIVQELAIIIAAKNHKPTILNPDFLFCTGIVPSDWQLARQPIYTNSVAQVTFTNGITIIAEPNRVIFVEPIAELATESLQIPAMSRKYMQTLPNIEFEAVGINPRGYVPFAGSGDAARQYMTKTLLSPGAWLEVGEEPMRASLNLFYRFKRAPFYLNVNEAVLRSPDETTTPIVMFNGSFTYEVNGESETEKLTTLYQGIENWQVDLETFQEIVNTKFLAEQAMYSSTVPDVISM